jgi:hypothetical protein
MSIPTPDKVQDLGTASGAGSTVVLTLAGLAQPTKVGNTVAVYVRTGGGTTLSSVADDKGNLWTVNQKGTSANANSALATALLTASLGNGDTITLTPSAASPNAIFGAAEFKNVAQSAAGVAAVETGSANAHGTTSPITVATSVAGANKHDLVLSVGTFSNPSATATVGASDPDSLGTWNQLGSVSTGVGGAYQSAPNSKTQFSAAWTASGGTISNIDACIVAFCPALYVSTPASNIPGGSIGTAYSWQMYALGGYGTQSWSISSGSLPAGLSISSGGLITGNPTTAGTSSLTFQVTDTGGNTATLDASITISGTGGFQITTGATLTAGTKNTPYSVTLATSGQTGTVTWRQTSGHMPPGILLQGSAGQLAGNTLAAGGTSKAQYEAWSTLVYPDANFKVYFSKTGYFPAPSSLSDSFENNTIFQTSIDLGITVWLCYRPTYAGTYADPVYTPGNPICINNSNLSTESNAMITSVQALQALGVKVGGVCMWQEVNDTHKHGGVSGQYMSLYTRHYPLWQAAKSSWPGGASNQPGLGIIYSGFNEPYATNNRTTTFFPGKSPFFPNDPVSVDWIAIDRYCEHSYTTGGDHPYENGTGSAYTTNPHTADIADYLGVPWGWTEVGNTAQGLTVTQAQMTLYLSDDSSTTPPGDATNSIQAVYKYRIKNNLGLIPMMWYENDSGTGSGMNTLTTNDYRVPLLCDISNSIGSFTAAQVKGTPTVNGTYTFTLEATDSGSKAVASQTFSLTIGTNTNPLSITTASPGPGTVTGSYGYTFGAQGGSQSGYTWSVSSGTVPAGLSLDSTLGALTGTPTTAGSYTFDIKVTDSSSNTATQSVTIVIYPLNVSGAPYLAGYASSGVSGSSSVLNIPLYTNVQADDSIVVGVLVDASAVVPTVGDSAGNTYTNTLVDTTETGAQLYVFECDQVNPLSALPPDPTDPNSVGDSLVVTYSASLTSDQAVIVVGGDGVTGIDKSVIAHGSSTAPASGTSGTLTSVEEQAVAFIVNTGGVPAWASPFSAGALLTLQAGTGAYISAAAISVSTNTALNASATIASAPWTAALTTLEILVPTLVLSLADGVEGDPYNQTFSASQGVSPYTYSITSGALPSGLTLATGVISGTPTTSGTFNFSVQVTDANGVSVTSPQTITILSNSLSTAPGVTFPSNLLTPADSDFEEGVGTWVSDANASSITTSDNAAVTGGNSLMWSATASGATSVHSGAYGVNGGQPYVASGYIMPCGQRDTQIGVNWYSDSAGTVLISQQLGPDNASESIGWQPVQAQLTAPSNAVSARVVALVQEANPGDVTHLDTVYFAPSKIQVLVDWVNPPFAVENPLAGTDFMDVTPFVRLDQNVTYSRGRQDMISEIQPGSAGFYLQNDTGMFTRYRNESLPAVTGGTVSIQHRAQINVADETGNWWTRFDGNINEIDYTFDSTGNTSLAEISVTDILGYLNRTDQMPCWTKSQILADGPSYHWTLDDPGNAGGAGVFAESSGNNGPPLRLWNSDTSGTATIAFKQTTGGIETLADAVKPGRSDGSKYWPDGSLQPNNFIRGLDSGVLGPYSSPLGGVYLTPKLTAQSAQNYFVGNKGYQLQTELPTTIAPNFTGSDYSLEVWFTQDPAIGTAVNDDYGPYVIASLGTSREGVCMIASIKLNGAGAVDLYVEDYNQPPAFLGKNYPGAAPPSVYASTSTPLNTGAGTNGLDTVQVPHHLVINISGDTTSPTVDCYLDGQEFTGGTFNLGKSRYFDTICLGGAFGGEGCHYGGLTLASIYGYALTQSQITDHCMLGQYGMWEQTTDDCIARLAGFANIPPYWNNTGAQHNGLSLTDYQDITGYSALSAMQTFEAAEQGLLFVDATGSLNFHTRDWRMGYGAPDLYLPPESFAPDMGYQVIDQFMQNESAIASTIYPTGVAYTNQNSQAQYGPYISNSPSSPAQFPLTTFNRAEGQLGLPSFGLNPDPNLSDMAAWDANTYSDPYLLPGQVTVDLLTLDPNDGLTIADYYSLEIDMMVAPSGTLPNSFPDQTGSLEWFIEGVSETIGLRQHTIQFYNSPAAPQRAWIPGDPAYGILGSTSRVGVSSTDLSTPPADGKDVSHDAGEPYWPPTFSADMNNPAQNGHSFVGNLEMRGLVEPVARMLNPPMCVVSAISQTQTQASGTLTGPQIYWDTIHIDTEGGMGLAPDWPNWYVCTVPGFYDIDASLVWSTGSGSAGGYMGQGWIVVAKQAAQALAAGTGGPETAPQYVCPVGESPRFNSYGVNAVDNPTTRVYLGLGDMVTLAAEQNTGSTMNTGTNLNGSHLSILFRGYATSDDGCQYNTSINGGTVSDKPKVTKYVKTYSNLATYSYNGSPYNYVRRYTSNPVSIYQGARQGTGNSQSAQIKFPFNTIKSDLNPGSGTVDVQSVTITGTNISAGTSTGCYAAFGFSIDTPGQSTFDAHTVYNRNSQYRFFKPGQTVISSLPLDFVTDTFGLQNEGKIIILGDSRTTKAQNYGEWLGGPGSWQLTIEYTVTI